ncbi:DUF817 domain-containing protein [Cognatishimia sp.]|uniref:DUF817 domain-containing protein n=1 Tax=Cognatishimia sp. TaxID=2211648 RepID=UPI003516931E
MTQPQTRTQRLERQLGDWMRARLPHVVAELVMFTLKQGWAALFGALLLVGIILSSQIWQADWPLARYDALLIYAVALQVMFLLTGLETWEEARVILLFHATGTAMEIFKVNAGSWSYPEPALFKLWDVPMFSGFMYASVGSYMARVIRLFQMRFAPYPPLWITYVLAGAIYINFFAHHFVADIRLVLFAATVVVFARTRVWFQIAQQRHWMPLPLAAFFSSFALWIAENVGTRTKTWLYSGQTAGELVSFAKLGSWYLLLYVSFVTVTIVARDALAQKGETT